jgi:P-type conjugative transfer protein TrbG
MDGATPMKRTVIECFAAACALVITDCAQRQRPIPPLQLATQVTEEANAVPKPPAPVDPLSLESSAVRAAVRDYQQRGEAPVIPGDRFLYPYELTGKPLTLICAPLHVTDLTLERGETVTDVATGDSERWLIEVTGSGNAQQPLPHVLIKPKDAPLKSNLVIMTNQRTYRLNLIARRTDNFTQAVGFYFPKELLAASEQAQAIAAAPAPTSQRTSLIAELEYKKLNLNYSVSGPDNVGWRPIRCFDDGAHTYIQMAASMKASEAPVLLIAGPAGNGLANYRIAGNYFVVDRLFDQAVLLAGVGRAQDRVTITYTGGPREGQGA